VHPWSIARIRCHVTMRAVIGISLVAAALTMCIGAASRGSCGVPRQPTLLPPVLVATLALPDGLGDVAFGECAVRELSAAPAAITWLRVYPSEAAWAAGEALIVETATAASASLAFPTPESFATELKRGSLIDRLWAGAREVFLAPWIFGIYGHDAPLLELVQRVGRQFWALSEYGRGMGHIQNYTGGLGVNVPTGWPSSAAAGSFSSAGSAVSGGVFKTILRSGRASTDWRARLRDRINLGVAGVGLRRPPRLWWAYGRKDSATAHELRLATATTTSMPLQARRDAEKDPLASASFQWPEVVKVIPVSKDGSIATGVARTTGDLLSEQAHAILRDPGRRATLDIVAPSEVTSHVAGQLSQLLVHILSQRLPVQDRAAAEVIIAPNLGLRDWTGSSIVRVVGLELLSPSHDRMQLSLSRQVFLVAEPVPRTEMRNFLEQCEPTVVATGDQSVAEAVLLGKLPFVRPDAKVEQWRLALSVMATGALKTVPDLGEVLRSLLWSKEARARSAAKSEVLSAAAEARARMELGSSSRSVAEDVLVRAGMFG